MEGKIEFRVKVAANFGNFVGCTCLLLNKKQKTNKITIPSTTLNTTTTEKYSLLFCTYCTAHMPLTTATTAVRAHHVE